jgi:hypothetical protein
MPADSKRKALADAQRAQAKFEKTREQIDQDGQTRRETFSRARDAGATLREIGESVGLHWTRVREIVSGR